MEEHTMNTRLAILAALTLGLLAVWLPTRAADSRPESRQQFDKNHPRRAEINKRIARQKRALKRQLKNGKITQAQYDAQMAQLKDIKQDERQDVKANGGSLTKGEQQGLNQDLNETRKEINANGGGAPAAPPAPPQPGQ
jgi:hypothetical protein